MKRTIYHIDYAKNGDVVSSWGEVCMMENIQYFLSQWEKNCILTTEKWKIAMIKWGLQESDLLSFHTIDSEDPTTPFKLFLNYIKRIFLAKKSLETIDLKDQDIIVCHSDFLPNALPMYWLAQKNVNTQLFFYFHMLYPSIFRGYSGYFTGMFNFPTLTWIYLKLSQLFYLFLIKKIARGTILSVNPYYQQLLEGIFNPKIYPKISLYTFRRYSGIQIPILDNKISDNALQNKIYDFVWMGRFHKQKGIEELFKICLLLKEKKPDFSLLIMWSDSGYYVNKLLTFIKVHSLEANIVYLWTVLGSERFEKVAQAKLFLMTSFYESFWQVNLESMKSWTPVVAYDLPIFEVFESGMIKVPILDNAAFVDRCLALLVDHSKYAELRIAALDFSADFSREKTGEEFYSLM